MSKGDKGENRPRIHQSIMAKGGCMSEAERKMAEQTAKMMERQRRFEPPIPPPINNNYINSSGTEVVPTPFLFDANFRYYHPLCLLI